MTLTAHLYRLYRKYMHRQTGLFCAFWKIFLLCFLGLQSFSLFGQNSAVRIDAPLKLVIPFGPGSGTDIYARMVAQSLSQAMGTSVIIDNRPGANGVLAADFVAKAKPDGNTLLLTTNTTHAANERCFLWSWHSHANYFLVLSWILSRKLERVAEQS